MLDKANDSWNRVARRYASMPIRNPAAYEATLARVRTHLKPEHSVLEMGCGTGTTALRLGPDVARYLASDSAPEMIAIAREKCVPAGLAKPGFFVAGIGDGSLPEGPFDVVVAFNLLHLLPDRKAALSEIRMMLPEGGLFISKTPCLGGVFRALQPLVAVLRWMRKAPDIRFVTPSLLEREIRETGFEIIENGDYPKRPPSHFIVARKL
ncbi:MAG: class I SAM-dependent methyltransferase [Roseobacter sp.]|jgi:SAM-dependent methyltransferase|nr:class I SAM-dependent methyltransferase [Roseobacter sp.]